MKHNSGVIELIQYRHVEISQHKYVIMNEVVFKGHQSHFIFRSLVAKKGSNAYDEKIKAQMKLSELRNTSKTLKPCSDCQRRQKITAKEQSIPTGASLA